jgi:hypothetical protein
MSVLNTYNQIVGSGGFGLVLKNDKNQVIKLLYSGGCNDAKKEFEKNKAVYDAFIMRSTHLQLVVPRPLVFNMENVEKNNVNYSCFYIMTYLHPIPPLTGGESEYPVLYHVINNEYEPLFNKVVGRVYTLPISDKNPPRGFFASYNYIRKLLEGMDTKYKGELQSIENVLEYMGYAFGTILFTSGYKPIDVEYVLCSTDSGKTLAMGILDFGMVEIIDWDQTIESIGNDIIDNVIDIDLYIPTPGSPEMQYFVNGLKNVPLGNNKKMDILKFLIDRLL